MIIIFLSDNVLSLNYERINYSKIETSALNYFTINSSVPVIIKLNREAELDNVLTDLPGGFELRGTFPFGNGFYGTITSRSAFESLSNIPDIKKIHFAPLGEPALTESVPLVNGTITWQKQITGLNITGAGETVCIIDTGIDYAHPDLADKVIAQYCYCNNILDGLCCPDGTAEDNNAYDDNGHGTRVSGIVAANGVIKGIAKDANLVVIKTCGVPYSKCDPSDITKAFQWCLANRTVYNISIISISIGHHDESNITNCLTYMDDEINNATNQNISVIASSGNKGYTDILSYPACSPNSTSVGATYDNDSISQDFTPTAANCTDDDPKVDDIVCFTNRDFSLDLLAPGGNINSTQPLPVRYAEDDGTSYAAPHVAGATALLIQYEKLKNNRTLTPAQIRNRFKETGKIITDNFNAGNNSKGTGLNFSRIDVYSALFPIDIYGFKISNSYEINTTNYIFGFTVRNNYNNKTRNISWSFDLDETTINSTESISLSPNEEIFVFVEHNFSNYDVFNVNITANSSDYCDSDTETMNLVVGDLIAHTLKTIYQNSTVAVFTFSILNHMSSMIEEINWSLTTNQTVVDSERPINITAGNETLVFVYHNYTSSGTYNVSANATNQTYVDSSRVIDILVPS